MSRDKQKVFFAFTLALLAAGCGKDFVLMVPGIRPVGSDANDQKRAMTPRQAVDLHRMEKARDRAR